MVFFKEKDPRRREWQDLMKKEAREREKRGKIPPPGLTERIPIPPKLEETLEAAFVKAFHLVFSKGAPLIEKTYSKDNLEKEYQEGAFSAHLRQDVKSLRAFSAKAKARGRRNVLVAGVEGVSLGLLGIGLPDIPLFSGVLLRSLYELSLTYGFPYEGEEEARFQLLLIEAALARGPEFLAMDDALNHWIDWGRDPGGTKDAFIVSAAQGLSRALLYLKFIQGIPIVGACGGISDGICLQKVLSYGRLKYQRRFLRQGSAMNFAQK